MKKNIEDKDHNICALCKIHLDGGHYRYGGETYCITCWKKYKNDIEKGHWDTEGYNF